MLLRINVFVIQTRRSVIFQHENNNFFIDNACSIGTKLSFTFVENLLTTFWETTIAYIGARYYNWTIHCYLLMEKENSRSTSDTFDPREGRIAQQLLPIYQMIKSSFVIYFIATVSLMLTATSLCLIAFSLRLQTILSRIENSFADKTSK